MADLIDINNGDTGLQARDKINASFTQVNVNTAGLLIGPPKLFKAAAIVEEDSALGTIIAASNGGTDPAYTYNCNDNPELFRWNGYLNLYDYPGGGVQPDQIDKRGAGSGENTGRGYDTLNVQVAVCTDAPEITYRILATGTEFCFKVEEEGQEAKFITKTPTALAGSGFQSLNVNFGSRGRRTITLCAPKGSGFALFGVRATGVDTFWSLTSSKKVAVIGDSFGAGLNLNAGGQYWCDIVADAFGWDNYLPSCVSGTGFINKTASNYYNYIERIPQIAAWNPEKVVVNVSVNDYSYTEAEIKAAVTEFIDTLTAALPAVEIIFIGALGRNQAIYKTIEQYAIDAIAENSYENIKFVPVQTETTYMNGWINGSGDASDLQGDGNADIYIQTDKLHPTLSGQGYLGYRVIQGMIEQGVRP